MLLVRILDRTPGGEWLIGLVRLRVRLELMLQRVLAEAGEQGCLRWEWKQRHLTPIPRQKIVKLHQCAHCWVTYIDARYQWYRYRLMGLGGELIRHRSAGSMYGRSGQYSQSICPGSALQERSPEEQDDDMRV